MNQPLSRNAGSGEFQNNLRNLFLIFFPVIVILLGLSACASSEKEEENPLDRLGETKPSQSQTDKTDPDFPKQSRTIVKNTEITDFHDRGYDLGFPGFGKSVSKKSGILDSLLRSNDKEVKSKAGYQTGFTVVSGDINGDGIDDIIVGLPNTRAKENEADQFSWVFVHWGRSFQESSLLPESADLIFFDNGEVESVFLGHSLAVGDVNGDGIDDLLIGAPRALNAGEKSRAGAAYLYFGRKQWEQRKIEVREKADVILLGENEKSLAGFSVHLGDLNGDGMQDIAVGAPGWGAKHKGAGRVYIVYGNSTLSGIRSLSDSDLILSGEFEKENQPVVDVKDSSLRKPDSSGYSLSFGDINGDGNDDLIVGTPFSDGLENDKSDSGEVSAFFGKTSLRGGLGIKSDADVRIFGSEKSDWFGIQLTSGDFNGDNVDDILSSGIHSAYRGDENDRPGAVYLIYGSPTIPRLIPDSNKIGLTIWGRTGIPSGRSLLIYDQEEKSRSYFFGYSTTFGDIDQDGFDDLAIGSPAAAAKDEDRRKLAGEVYMIKGISNEWGSRTIQNYADRQYLGEEPNGQLGSSVALGDVNGDGLIDILMGAPGVKAPKSKQPETGKVYLVFGTSENLERSAED